MTENKHTPGPWSESDHAPNLVTIGDIAGSVADVSRWIGGEHGDAFENLANARLIAAAPDLLAACRAMYAAFKWQSDAEFEAMELARLALARAEGGAE